MSIEAITSVGKNNIQTSIDYVTEGNPVNPKENGVEEKESAPDLNRIQEAVIALQNNMKVFHKVNLDFSVHQATGQIMVTVTDQDTGKVIREIPPKEILNLKAKLEEMIGLIFDQQI